MGFEYKDPKTGEVFVAPEWWECAWRRLKCGKDDCKMCGRMKDMEEGASEVSEEITGILETAEQGVLSGGFVIDSFEDSLDPPEPSEFPLHERVRSFQRRVDSLSCKLESGASEPKLKEALEDLRWYALTINSKTYRQLCNRWEIDRGDEFSEFDYAYTRYVIRQVLTILSDALNEFLIKTQTHRPQILLAIRQLAVLEREILQI